MLSKTVTGLCLDDAGTLWGVEVASSLRGISVRRVGRWEPSPDLPAGDPRAGWATLIAQARAEGFASSGEVVVGLPSQSTFQKRLSFPFRGRSRISQVLRSSMEGEIPVPIGEAEVDFLILPSIGPGEEPETAQGRRKGAEVLALACVRSAVETVRESFPPGSEGAGRAPILQTDGLGLAAAARELGVRDGAAIWVRGPSAVMVRMAGGQVGEIRRLRSSRAEDLPPQVAAILAGWGEGGRDVLLAGASWDRLPLRSALREGGAERILEGEDAALLRSAGVDDPAPFLPALGLALVGLGRGVAPFDLLRPRKAASEGWGWTAPRVRTAVLAGAVVLIGLAAFLTDSWAARRDLDAQSERLRTAFAALFPGQKAVNETAQLNEKIRVLSRRLDDLSSGVGPGSSPLSVMGELSRVAPPEMDLKLDELAVEPGRLRLDASLPGFEAIDRIKAAMESSPLFSGVKVQNARVGANAGRVSFRLQAEVL